MHRWFFADDEIFCKDPTPTSRQSIIPKLPSTPSVVDTNWQFKVKFDGKLCANEFLAVSGSCVSLGNWDVQLSLPLKRQEDSTIWTLTVPVVRKTDIRYRYLICALNSTDRKIVRFWETHFEARLISRGQHQIINSIEPEIFGLLNKKLKIERGWLNSYATVVQFKFNHAPFVLNISEKNVLLHVKITPIKINDTDKSEKVRSPSSECPTVSSPAFAFCEVATLESGNGEFHKQPQYGTPCGPKHLIMFNLTLDDKEHTAYLIDLYNFVPKSGPDVPLNHFGYQYVLPQDLENSDGAIQLVIMCGTKHRPIGSMRCDYLVVRPMRGHDFNLEKTFQRYWPTEHEGKLIGHRGCGNSFWYQNNILRENTINSFSLAIEHGADMVECDVQLSKDMVPILWHDLRLYVAMRADYDPKEYDIMHLPLTIREIEAIRSAGDRVEKDLIPFPLSKFTLEQLRRVKFHQPLKDIDAEENCFSDPIRNQPFSTLEQVMKDINIKAGLVLDIKWPQKFVDETGQEPLVTDFDKNEFLDSILDVVLRNAGSRRILFLSFDADICTMVRLKQNLYPVAFLIRPYSSERKFIDPRGRLIPSSTYFANAMELLGICINCLDILEIPGKVSNFHERDMCVFSWGNELRTEETRQYLRALGVDGIICDRLNHVLKPVDLKGSLFYIVEMENNVPHKKQEAKEDKNIY